MALQLVESVFVSGVRYPTSAVVGTVAAPVAAPSANLPLIESVESGGVRYPTFVLVTGTAALPAGEPLIESVVYDGARYPALAIADTTLASTEDVYSVVRGTQRFPCAVEVSGPFTSTVPNTHLTDGIVVSGVRYPAMTFSVGGGGGVPTLQVFSALSQQPFQSHDLNQTLVAPINNALPEFNTERF